MMFFIHTFTAEFFQDITENFDEKQGMNQFVESTQNTLNNLRINTSQAVENIIFNTENSIKDLTSQNFPDLGANLSPVEKTINDWKIVASEKLKQILSDPENTVRNLTNQASNFLDTALLTAKESFSHWKTNIVEALEPILSNPHQNLKHLVTEISNFLEPKLDNLKYFVNELGGKLDQFWQSSSQSILDHLGNPNNWNGETIGRTVENVFSSITKSIFFIVQESIKGIWHGVLVSVHDIWGVLALVVIGLFILVILRWQFVR